MKELLLHVGTLAGLVARQGTGTVADRWRPTKSRRRREFATHPAESLNSGRKTRLIPGYDYDIDPTVLRAALARIVGGDRQIVRVPGDSETLGGYPVVVF